MLQGGILGRILNALNHWLQGYRDAGFFHIGNAPADHGNRRTDLPGHAAWEIHPVMKLNVQ
jgi:hypothetical protein